MKKPILKKVVKAAAKAGARVAASLDKKRVLINVRNCARCGGNHKKLEFTKLTIEGERHSHWAPCPTNGEPVMLVILPG